jgi:hypothetical protein
MVDTHFEPVNTNLSYDQAKTLFETYIKEPSPVSTSSAPRRITSTIGLPAVSAAFSWDQDIIGEKS